MATSSTATRRIHGQRGTMAYVTLESLIPEADPQKARIEDEITEAFEKIPGGPWRITMTRPTAENADGEPTWSVHVAGQGSVLAGALRSANVDDFMARSLVTRAF